MHENLNLNTTEKKLLYDIRELLIEQNRLITQILPGEGIKTENNAIGDDLDSLKRSELIARVKELPDKPGKWTLLPNDELKTLIRRSEK